MPVQAGRSQGQPDIVSSSAGLGGCPMFPANNIWNTPVNGLPVHARSDQWVNSIGRNTGFHMDFGSGTWAGGPIGIPYNIVSGSTTKVPVSFYYPDQSDPGPYPIPTNPLIEYGSDHHILIVENSSCTLYEIYDASYSGGLWHAGSGAIWSLSSNDLRPDTWTSADAAGLSILPGLVRYDEILGGEIRHAIRFTAENTNRYIWPARHLTSDDPSAPQIPPMGARFRLKASYNISGYPSELQIILNAMKTYGIILADNGSDWYVSGTPDERWDNDMLHLLDGLTGDDFEAVDTSRLMVDYDSGATGLISPGNPGDFDGDGKTDPAKFYSSNGTVWWLKSSTEAWDGRWLGPDTFIYVPSSDFDGDGKTDPAKFYSSNGTVWWLKSSTGTWDGKYLGSDSFTYVSGSDFDGDGKTDPAKFYPGTGTVWWLRSSTGMWDGKYLGSDSFTYVPGSDFDGDGKTDPAKFYPSTGTVWWLKSSTLTWEGRWLGSDRFTFLSGSDFDGDGKTDAAKFYPGTGTVWWLKSSTGAWDGRWLGSDTFTYLSASDFDGDGKTDPAKFYPSTGVLWWLQSSTGVWDGVWLGGDIYSVVK